MCMVRGGGRGQTERAGDTERQRMKGACGRVQAGGASGGGVWNVGCGKVYVYGDGKQIRIDGWCVWCGMEQ